ncbi:MAG: VacJ family lipoprotein [Sphingobium sp.]
MSVSTITLALLLSGMAATTDDAADETTEQAAPASEGAETALPPPVAPVEATGGTAAPSVDQPEAPEQGATDDAIVVTGGRRVIRADPLLGVNIASFNAIQAVDKAVVAPTARTYEKIVPKPVRNGLRNALINLAEPVVFLNYLLQFKPGKAAETAGRFALNSTIGVAGLFDMARRKPFRLPYRQNGFANTFGYHGIKQGPFLFVPILGPTTARDLIGRLLDLAVVPAAFGKPFNRPIYSITTGTVKSMNDRVEFDEQLTQIRESGDPYVVTRDLYLKRRQTEIEALHSQAWRDRHGIVTPAAPATPAQVPLSVTQPAPSATNAPGVPLEPVPPPGP